MNSFRLGFVPLLGRVLMAAIFIQGGFGKLAFASGVAGMVAAKGLPLPEVGAWVAILTEAVGGILILVGLFTRPAAAWLAAWCVVTGVIYHYVPGDQNMMIHFAKNICMAGGFLQLSAWGGGTWSLDSLFRRTRTAAHAPA